MATLKLGKFNVNSFYKGRTLLHWAAHQGNARMVTCLLEYNADINLRAGHARECSGFTALDFAAKAPGKPEVVARLLIAEVSFVRIYIFHMLADLCVLWYYSIELLWNACSGIACIH